MVPCLLFSSVDSYCLLRQVLQGLPPDFQSLQSYFTKVVSSRFLALHRVVRRYRGRIESFRQICFYQCLGCQPLALPRQTFVAHYYTAS